MKKWHLVKDDYFDTISKKLDRVSDSCNLSSTELRDIQNMIGLIKTDFEYLQTFVRDHCELKTD